MATRAGFEPAIFSVTGRYAKPLHQQAVHNKDANNEVAPVKVYQGQLIAVKLKLKEQSVFRFRPKL